MTDILKLDLDDDGDGGLLVGFGKRDAPLPANKKDSQTLFAEVTPTKRTLLGNFWGRSNRKNNPPQDTNSLLDSLETKDTGNSWGGTFNDEQKESARRHSDFKTTTFSFPNAPVVHAVDEDFFGPLPTLNETNEAALKELKEKSEEDVGDDEEDGSDDDESGDEESEEEASPEPKTESPVPNQRSKWDYEVYNEPQPRQWTKDGFGSDPVKAEKKGVFGFLGRLGRSKSEMMTVSEQRELERQMKRAEQNSLRSMKVATETTKDEKTLAESIAKAALVVLVPELYGEDEEENLGMYRSISTTADEDVAVAKPSLEKIYALQKKIKELEKHVKSAELEANSWKLRAKELEDDLRDCRGGDSSDDDDEESESEEDDGIEEIYQESNLLGDAVVVQGPGVDGPNLFHAECPQQPKIKFDPLTGRQQSIENSFGAMNGNDSQISMSASSTSLQPPASSQATVNSTTAFDHMTPVFSDGHMIFLNQPTPFSTINGDAGQSAAVVSYDPMNSLPRPTSTATMNGDGPLSSMYASSNQLQPPVLVSVAPLASENPVAAFDPMAPMLSTSTVSCNPMNSFKQPTSMPTMDFNGLLLFVNAHLSSSQTSEPLPQEITAAFNSEAAFDPLGRGSDQMDQALSTTGSASGLLQGQSSVVVGAPLSNIGAPAATIAPPTIVAMPPMPTEMPPPPPVPPVEPKVGMCLPPLKPQSFDQPPPPSTPPLSSPTEDDVDLLPADLEGVGDAVFIQVEPTTSDPPCAVMPPPDAPPNPCEKSHLPEIVPAMEETEGETPNPSESDPSSVPPMHPPTPPEHFQGAEVEVPEGETLTPPASNPPQVLSPTSPTVIVPPPTENDGERQPTDDQ